MNLILLHLGVCVRGALRRVRGQSKNTGWTCIVLTGKERLMRSFKASGVSHEQRELHLRF